MVVSTNLHRLDWNTQLERRLQAIEQKLLVLDSDRRFSGVHSTASPAICEGRRPQTPDRLARAPGQHDEVDGMGSVPLKDGAGEGEYFGTVGQSLLQI